MKNNCLTIALFFAATNCWSQQTPLFTVYRDQWAILNPAVLSNNYLINERTMSLSATHHRQWWGLPNSPSTQLLNWEWVQEDYNSIWGAHLANDRTGEIGQAGLHVRYAYRLQLGRRSDQSLTIGLSAGMVQYRANLSEITFPDPNTSPTSDDRLLYPDFGLGVFYHYEDRYYAGLSVPQAFGLTTNFESDGNAFSIKRVQHLMAVVGGYWSITWFGNETSFVEPSLWLKWTPNAPPNLNLNARCQISELVWAGTGLNTGLGQQLGAALQLEAGMVFGEQVGLLNGQFKVGFGFELPLLNRLGNYFGQSGELNLVYSWQ